MPKPSWLWSLGISLVLAVPFSVIANLLTPKSLELLKRAGISWRVAWVAFLESCLRSIQRTRENPSSAIVSLIGLGFMASFGLILNVIEHEFVLLFKLQAKMAELFHQPNITYLKEIQGEDRWAFWMMVLDGIGVEFFLVQWFIISNADLLHGVIFRRLQIERSEILGRGGDCSGPISQE